MHPLCRHNSPVETVSTPDEPFNLSVHPELYPGEAIKEHGLLMNGVLLPFSWDGISLSVFYQGNLVPLPELLLSLSQTPLRERQLLIAVGSNAVAAVLDRKLASADTSRVVPSFLGSAKDLSVGFSAHVSQLGFIPATPYRDLGVQSPIIVSAVDDGQLEQMDLTEPNYIRRPWSMNDLTINAEGWSSLGFHKASIYVSLHGVLLDDRGAPFEFTTQEELFRRLAELGVLEPAEMALCESTIPAGLGRSAQLRQELTARLHKFCRPADI